MRKFLTLFFICSSLFSSAKTIWVCNTGITYIKEETVWKEYLKSSFEYDNNGNKIQQIFYNWDGKWKESTKYVYSYDGNGNQTQSTYYTWDNGWQEYMKGTSEYDGNGNIIQGVDYIMEKSKWKEYLKSSFEYDNNGNKIQQTFYNWDGKWKESTKYVYSYDGNGNQTQSTYYTWNNGWKEYMKETNEYKSIVIDGNESLGTAAEDELAAIFNVYVYDNTITIENATDEIRVYNTMGNLVAKATKENIIINVNSAGVYIVKVGNVVKRVIVN
ncbi:MAG: hypothetical protein J6W13_02420 [Salinivirgaceae bacterium]|nr:hypothetical protein [Salinivirgaceae bacterium]